MKDLKYFKKKSRLLDAAKRRVQRILTAFVVGERKDVEKWDLVHNLNERLDERIGDNWSEFKDWHWDNYGFNVY